MYTSLYCEVQYYVVKNYGTYCTTVPHIILKKHYFLAFETKTIFERCWVDGKHTTTA